MNSQELYITYPDLMQLAQAIADAQRQQVRTTTEREQLKRELARRVPVTAEDVPSDVVTLNSDVQLLDLATGDIFGCTLVLPEEADAALFKVSVLAPIGMALLGHRVGDVIAWAIPGGAQRIKVLRLLYQPETADQ
jgi:regulator of nucleoside diphosphate kinase